MKQLLVRSSLFVVFFLLFLLLTPNYQHRTTNALTSGCATPQGTDVARVIGGLVTTPSLGASSQFYTSEGKCIVNSSTVFSSIKIPNYADLKSLYFNQANASSSTKTTLTPSVSPGATQTDIPFSSVTGYNIYAITGSFNNLTLGGNNTGTGTGVIFVDGYLNITSNYTYGTSNSGAVFIVSGNVYIESDVTQIDGVIIAGGTIYTATPPGASPSTCSASSVNVPKLTINGSLISITQTSPIVFCRSLSDNTQASEVINHQPKYLVLLRNIVSQKLQKWSEIAGGGTIPGASSPPSYGTPYTSPPPPPPIPTPTPTPIPTPTPTPAPPPGNSDVATRGSSSQTGPIISGTLTEGNAISFSGEVGNGPSATSNLTTITWYRFCIDNLSCLTTTTNRVGTDRCIHPGNVSSGCTAPNTNINGWYAGMTPGASWSATTGSHTIYLCGDVTSAVTEVNESNNCSANTFTVATPTATAPGAPIIGTAIPGNTQGTVTWTAPANGGSPITQYIISAHTSNGSFVKSTTMICPCSTLSQTITGLTNGVLYKFAVRAYNAIGEGNISGYSNSITPTATPFPSSGLVSYWKLDESGSPVADSSDSNPGTVVGTVSSVAGKLGNAKSFNGTNNSRIEIGDKPNLALAPFTISAWVSRTGVCSPFASCAIFSKGNTGNTGYSLELVDTGGGNYKARVNIKDGIQHVIGATTLNLNTWYHIVATVDGSTSGNIKIYINNILDANVVQTALFNDDHKVAKIGTRNDGSDITMNGVIDEVGFWNRALTPTEISTIWNGGSGSTYP